MRSVHQHGEKGVFVGGDWVNIEECDKKFNICGGSGECTRNCETCPRSKTRHTSAKKDQSYDVVIIGGGYLLFFPFLSFSLYLTISLSF